MNNLKRLLLIVGTIAATLGAYGAFSYAVKLDGYSYLAFAAPLVAIIVAIIPYVAERTWKNGDKVKSLICWALLIPTAAVVFFTTTERVHFAKANVVAERNASRSAVDLAKIALVTVERKLDSAEKDVKLARAKGRKVCDNRCIVNWEQEAAASRIRVNEARIAVTQAEAKSVNESTLVAPTWLLPVCIDGISFTFLWLGLSLRLKVKKRFVKRKSRKNIALLRKVT